GRFVFHAGGRVHGHDVGGHVAGLDDVRAREFAAQRVDAGCLAPGWLFEELFETFDVAAGNGDRGGCVQGDSMAEVRADACAGSLRDRIRPRYPIARGFSTWSRGLRSRATGCAAWVVSVGSRSPAGRLRNTSANWWRKPSIAELLRQIIAMRRLGARPRNSIKRTLSACGTGGLIARVG